MADGQANFLIVTVYPHFYERQAGEGRENRETISHKT
jgi:hypothetical protein